MGMLLDASAVSSVSGFSEVLSEMLSMGTTLIQWCLTTFPVNVSIAGAVVGVVIGVIRRSRGIAK